MTAGRVFVYEALRNHLENGIIPFWLRSWDGRYGGFMTNFDAEGRPTGTPEKYLNTQARLVWWFSALCRHYSDHPDRDGFRRLADLGTRWLIANFWDEEFGGWFWKVRREGPCLVADKIVYGQSFAVYALSEYVLATGDEAAQDYAERTFDLLQKYCADTRHGGYHESLEADWAPAPPGFAGGDRKGLDTHMHLMEAFTNLYAATGRGLHRRKLHEIVDLIVARMVDPTSGYGRNQMDSAFDPIPAIAIRHTWNAERAGEQPAVPTNTTSYGHNVELAWLLHRALEVAGLDPAPYRAVTRRLVEHAVRHGIDRKYGGIFRDGITDGTALVQEKEWWQQAESLVGFLDAYETFGEEQFWEAFVTVWQFVDRYVIQQEVGEWRTLLTREGTSLDADIGNPWKVSYHSGRAVLECLTRLEGLPPPDVQHNPKIDEAAEKEPPS